MVNPNVKQLASPLIEALRKKPYGYRIIDGSKEENAEGVWVFRYPLADSFALVIHTKKPIEFWKYEIEGEGCEKKNLTIAAKNALAEFIEDYRQVQVDIAIPDEKFNPPEKEPVIVAPEDDVPPDLRGYKPGGKNGFVNSSNNARAATATRSPTKPVTNAVAIKETNAASYGLFPFTDKELASIRQTVAKGATESEFIMLMRIAKEYQLDPFLKEIFFSSQLKTVMTSRDGYLKIAHRHPDFEGIRSMAVCANDDFEVDISNDTIVHKFGKQERGKVIGAWAIVYRKGWKPAIAYADLNEYKKSGGAWQYMSAMICKCAEAFALKRQFAISGLVTREEVEFETFDALEDTKIIEASYVIEGEAAQATI